MAIDLRLVGYRQGGITRYALELLEALRRLHLPELAITELRSVHDTSDDRAIRLRTPPHHRLELQLLPVELRLRGIRLDVFHAVDFIAPKLRGTRVVATVHDLAFLERPDDLAADALAWYQHLREARSWTDAWIAPSRWTADQLSEVYDIDPRTISVIPHGVPAFLADVDSLPREDRDNFVLIVGTVEPRKRIDQLLDALPMIPEPVRLVVVGASGWKSGDIEARLRNTPRVEWRQAVDDTTLRDLYRRALVLAAPSHLEGFGFSALEAMACGTPVVSSGGGALTEVTDDAALYADDDPTAWASAIARLCEERAEWESLAASGRARAKQFMWEEAAARTAEVYLDRAPCEVTSRS